MKVGNFYRITYDQPVHDLIVKITDDHYDGTEAEVVKVFSGPAWKVGSIVPIYPDTLEKVEKVSAPVEDGDYIGDNGRNYKRINGEWYDEYLKGKADEVDQYVGDTLHKVT